MCFNTRRQQTDASGIKVQINERVKDLQAPSGKRTVSIKGRGKLSVARERARAPRALACGIGVRCLRAHRRVGGGIASPGMRARQLRVCLCVCDTDGCANGKTDRCLGGSNGMQRWSASHICGEIRAKTSSICGDQAITQILQRAWGAEREPAASRFKARSNTERGAAEFRFPADPPKGAASPAIDERESRGAAAAHLAHKTAEGARTAALGNSPSLLSAVLQPGSPLPQF